MVAWDNCRGDFGDSPTVAAIPLFWFLELLPFHFILIFPEQSILPSPQTLAITTETKGCGIGPVRPLH